MENWHIYRYSSWRSYYLLCQERLPESFKKLVPALLELPTMERYWIKWQPFDLCDKTYYIELAIDSYRGRSALMIGSVFKNLIKRRKYYWDRLDKFSTKITDDPRFSLEGTITPCEYDGKQWIKSSLSQQLIPLNWLWRIKDTYSCLMDREIEIFSATETLRNEKDLVAPERGFSVDLQKDTSSTRTIETHEMVNMPYQFYPTGDGWLVRFSGGRRIFIKQRLGMEYLHYLLARPYESVPFQQFVKPDGAPSADDNAHLGDDLTVQSGLIEIDSDAGTYTNDELQTLKQLEDERSAELAKPVAQRSSDLIKEKTKEIKHIEQRIQKRAQKPLHGVKLTGAWTVTKPLVGAIDYLKKKLPALGTYLEKNISTGNQLEYHPSEIIEWLLSDPEEEAEDISESTIMITST